MIGITVLNDSTALEFVPTLLSVTIMCMQIVTITSQGQLTIPKSMREQLGLLKGAKASISVTKNRQLMVEPHTDFWSLSGSLQSSVTLSPAQLKKARKAFSTQWARKS